MRRPRAAIVAPVIVAFALAGGCAAERPVAEAGAAAAAPVTLVRVAGIESDPLAEHPLSQIGQVLVDRSGNLYVTQPRERRILAFSMAGVFRRALGAPGEGPGEFAALSVAGLHRDTLWAADWLRRRVSWFTADSLLRDDALAARLPSGTAARPLAFLADGSVLLIGEWSLSSLAAAQDPADRSVELARGSRDGTMRSAVGTISLRTKLLVAPSGSGTLLAVQPFDDSPIVAAAQDGSAFVIVDRAVAAGRRTFHVTRIAATGDTLFSRGREYVPVPVDDDDIEATLARLGPPLDALDPGSVYRPPHRPPVDAVIAARDGTTWLRRADRGAETATWEVLAADGAQAELVTLPAEVRLHEADGRRLWTSMEDADGVPRVVVYDRAPVQRFSTSEH